MTVDPASVGREAYQERGRCKARVNRTKREAKVAALFFIAMMYGVLFMPVSA
jgi:hypothetical protein